jgi:hypothetical protein
LHPGQKLLSAAAADFFRIAQHKVVDFVRRHAFAPVDIGESGGNDPSVQVVAVGAEWLQLVIGEPFGEFRAADLVDLGQGFTESQGQPAPEPPLPGGT